MTSRHPDGVDEFEYLESHDAQRNSHKFYQLAREGRLVHFQWGRVGTKGNGKVKEFGSEGRASNVFHDHLQTKLNEGYERAARPSDAPEVPVSGTSPASPDAPATSEDYFLEWSVEQGRELEEAALNAAYQTTWSVLAEVPELGLSLDYFGPHGVTGGHVKFYEDGEHKTSFGFPPQSFLDALSSRERRAVLELGTSRDGWLSATGKGQGVISTDKSKWDFAVRLFLSVLATRYDLKVSCSLDLEYGTRGVRATETEHSQFGWFPFWNALKPAVGKHWFVEGDSNIIVDDSAAGVSPYAW